MRAASTEILSFEEVVKTNIFEEKQLNSENFTSRKP